MMGIACLIVAEFFLALSTTITLVMIGIVFCGLHMALTQGLFASLVADTAPESLRGTAFGVFNFAGGIAMLAASVLAGRFWEPMVRRRRSWLAPASPRSRWSVLLLPKDG